MKYLFLDLRALALMRIGIACVLMWDLVIRVSDLEAFYTDAGLAPLEMIFHSSWNKFYVSLHTISGLWIVQLSLFVLAFFCACLLFIGYRTRLFTILSWFLLLSLHNRNTLILQGGDDLLRLVLFWAMFIPWGAKYSCDSLLERKHAFNPQILTVATCAYLLQVCYIYTGSALIKGPEWHTHFSALYYAYSLDQIAYPFSKLIYYYPELLKKLTFLVFYFELFVPILFFIPFRHSFFRTLGVLSIICFHAFNSLSLLIGLFPAIGIATILGLLPSPVMDRWDRLTVNLKKKIKLSFTTYAGWLQLLIRWRPSYELKNEMLKNLRSALLVFLIVFVFDWNFSNLAFVKSRLSDKLRFIGYGLRLDQSWGMFAPGVFKDDGWYILEGRSDKKKNTIDLLQNGQPVTYQKPKYIVQMFKNDRWRKYSENLIFSNNDFMRPYFCNYRMRLWNEKNPDKKIDELSVIFMKELTLPDYHYSRPEPNTLCNCRVD